jgi:hypothetical protein
MLTMAHSELSDRLRELEQVLIHSGAPIVQVWQQGLSPTESQAMSSRALGFSLPHEVEAWFAWHNGVAADLGFTKAEESFFIGSDYPLLSLEECIETHRRIVEMVEGWSLPPGPWPRTWLPLSEAWNGDLLVIDCGVPFDLPSPVYAVRWDEGFMPPRTPSLTAAVVFWLRLFREQLWRYDGRKGWVCDFERMDKSIRTSGLI